jgi:butyryl-CoA dehydrogenase
MRFQPINDGTLTTEQLDLQAMVHNFVEKELAPIAAELDRESKFPVNVYKKACDIGLSTLTMPEKYGGGGISFLTEALVTEEYAWADSGFGASMGAHGLGMKPLLFAGTEEQRRHFADVANSGGLSAFALTEPEAGSDAGALKTTAVKVGNDYVLNGRKCFATNAPIADIFTIFATVDKSRGVRGISAFLVDKGVPGLTTGKHEDKLGQRSSLVSDIILEDVKVPAQNLIGAEGQGFSLAMQTLTVGRAHAAAGATGVGRAAMEHCVKYAQGRVTMGKPIIKHQGLQFMMADMASMVEAARQMGWYAARLLDAQSPRSVAVSAMAKCIGTDMVMKVVTDAVQVLGGYGYSKEYPVEKLFRDAKIFQIYEGTNQIQRTIVGGWLPKLY